MRGALAAAGLTGVSFAEVQLPRDCGEIALWELVIHGRAFRRQSTIESLRMCDVCGRLGFPSPKVLSVDEARWDGSDFLILDYNPNIVAVTERVAEVIDANAFTNIMVEPID